MTLSSVCHTSPWQTCFSPTLYCGISKAERHLGITIFVPCPLIKWQNKIICLSVHLSVTKSNLGHMFRSIDVEHSYLVQMTWPLWPNFLMVLGHDFDLQPTSSRHGGPQLSELVYMYFYNIIIVIQIRKILSQNVWTKLQVSWRS